jgi:hypothetical protein
MPDQLVGNDHPRDQQENGDRPEFVEDVEQTLVDEVHF